MKTAGEESTRVDFLRECTLIARKWRTFYDNRIAAMGLTAARATVIYWLSELPEWITQSELADTIEIEGPTLVRLLSALVAQGVVERREATLDRRAKQVRLTPKGWEQAVLIREQNDLLSEEVFGSINTKDVDKALKPLRKVREAFDATRKPRTDKRQSA